MQHPTVNGVPRYDMCDLDIIVRRTYAVFLVKSLITTLIVVLGSLITSACVHAPIAYRLPLSLPPAARLSCITTSLRGLGAHATR